MLTTERLLLRSWRDTDLAPFAAMNADPAVRRYFPGLQTKVESDASVRRFRAHDEEHGFTFWAAELREAGAFIGFVGMVVPGAYLPLPTGCVEIGWRLATEHWGKGYATEAARACVEYAFGELKVPAVAAITTVENQPSINVMKKLGMVYHGEFLHPKIDPTDPIAPHVAYVVERP
ncbi:GNAT family N-acetyltransferase [Lewinella sp. 4G2]|uniref:GNAT family N-acetyltransferase n=1 Tax=Lewinella sp. 4G2 TaxID=1803372 RepID=UPI0018D3EAA2|nr:GNAT family N-acetyltransferase [Lewinella sp. 4G2]